MKTLFQPHREDQPILPIYGNSHQNRTNAIYKICVTSSEILHVEAGGYVHHPLCFKVLVEFNTQEVSFHQRGRRIFQHV